MQIGVLSGVISLTEIGVGRIRTFQFSSDSTNDSVTYDPMKTSLSESETEAEEPTNHNASSQES